MTLCANSFVSRCLAYTTHLQDRERSFTVNIRISIVETAGPLCSASAIVVVGALSLLLFSYASAASTIYIREFGVVALFSVLLSLLHALILAPTLLLVCGEAMSIGARAVPELFTRTWHKSTRITYENATHRIDYRAFCPTMLLQVAFS